MTKAEPEKFSPVVEARCGIVLFACAPLWIWAAGFAIAQLWTWFAVPFGAPTVTPGQATGFRLIVSALTYHLYVEDSRPMSTRLASVVTVPLSALGVGWVIHRLILAGW